MIHRNNRLALAGIAALGLASSLSAWDEYAPVAPGKGEVDLSATYEIAPDAGGFTPSLQIKYGLGAGLDLEVSEALATDPKLGFKKPNVALKYNDVASGLGGFVAVDLPVASEKIDSSPHAYFIFGAQYLRTFGRIVLNDWLYFGNSFRSHDDGKLDLYVKPQFMVTDEFGPYVGVGYSTSGKLDGYAFVFRPGFTYAIHPTFTVEANLPLAKAKGSDMTTGLYAGVYGAF